MISTFLVGLAIRQDAVQFKFQPKVGEKYRYAMSVTDDEGRPMGEGNEKLFSVFKIAGIKDEKFTVHQFLENGSVKSEPHLMGTFRIDSLLNSEMIATDQDTDAGTAGAAMVSKLFGAFGIVFSSAPVKVGEMWKPSFDAKAVAKSFMDQAMPGVDAKMDADGSISVTLDKLDEKSGAFHTVMHMKVDLSVVDNGQTHHVIVTTDCDQTSSVDRATGLPVKLDRKFSMSMKVDSDTNTTSMVIHMVRA